MNINLKSLILAVSVAAAVTGCGKSESTEPASSPEVETAISTHESGLNDAINSGDIRQASNIADSLALMVDDLTPAQTVSVLATFADVVNKARAEHNSRRAYETMRKYVDVYDIGLSINPKDLRKALEADRRYNFDSLATAYRTGLTDYAVTPVTEELPAPKPEQTDSIE